VGRDRERLIDWDLLCSSVQSARQAITSAGSLTRGSREQLGDRLFTELFCRELDRKVERAELLLSGILAYVKAVVPSAGPSSLRTLVEEADMRHATKISEKRIHFSAQSVCGPVTITVPEAQLRYMVDAALRIALDLVPPGGSIEMKVAGSGSKMTRPQGTARAAGDDATVDVVVNKSRRPPGPSQSTPSKTPEARDVGYEPEMRLLAELTEFYGGHFTKSHDSATGRVVLSLILPLARQEVTPCE